MTNPKAFLDDDSNENCFWAENLEDNSHLDDEVSLEETYSNMNLNIPPTFTRKER